MKDIDTSLKTVSLFDFKVIPLYDTIKHAKISDEEYFSSKYKQCISNSKLKLIDSEEGGSPEKYKIGLKSSFNPSFIPIACINLKTTPTPASSLNGYVLSFLLLSITANAFGNSFPGS